jgi:hypothetical protein
MDSEEKGLNPTTVQCEFCDRWLDESEELTPVWIGEQPEPKPITTRTVEEKDRRLIGKSKASPRDGTMVLGRPIDEVKCLMAAVEQSPVIDARYKQAVHTVQAVGEKTSQQIAGANEFDSYLDTEKVGVSLRVQPENDVPSPDLRVCEYCERSLKGESHEN